MRVRPWRYLITALAFTAVVVITSYDAAHLLYHAHESDCPNHRESPLDCPFCAYSDITSVVLGTSISLDPTLTCAAAKLLPAIQLESRESAPICARSPPVSC
jgi:hypothetical protein